MIAVLDGGVSTTVQDAGRFGWQHYGVPAGGAMDDLSMNMANLLVGNPTSQTVLETALSGVRLKALRDVVLGVTGTEGVFAVGEKKYGGWQTIFLPKGETFEVRKVTQGVWTYIAVPSGFDAPTLLASASTYSMLKLGRLLKRRDVLHACEPGAGLPEEVALRSISPWARRQSHDVVRLRMWPGPQRRQAGARAMTVLLTTEWTVSPKRDRVGYRLLGPKIKVANVGRIVEPIPPGAVQIDRDGRPVVAMRDCPTLGAAPKVGILDTHDVGRLAQCRPGQKVAFLWVKRT